MSCLRWESVLRRLGRDRRHQPRVQRLQPGAQPRVERGLRGRPLAREAPRRVPDAGGAVEPPALHDAGLVVDLRQRGEQHRAELGGRDALLRPRADGGVHRVADVGGQVAARAAQRRDALPDARHGLGSAGAPDRVDAAERLVDDEAERVGVGGRRHPLAPRLLGRHVRERPDHVAGPRDGVVVAEAGDPEVRELRRRTVPRGVGADDVRRLHVAVHDPACVRVGEGVAQRGADAQHVAVRERPRVLELREGRPADELGDEDPAVLVAARLVEGDDRRMTEARGRDGLARRALARLVARALGVHRDALDRDVAVEVLVVRLPHDAHAAAAETAAQPVAPEDELAPSCAGDHSGGLVVHLVRVRRGCRVSSLHGQEMTG